MTGKDCVAVVVFGLLVLTLVFISAYFGNGPGRLENIKLDSLQARITDLEHTIAVMSYVAEDAFETATYALDDCKALTDRINQAEEHFMDYLFRPQPPADTGDL